MKSTKKILITGAYSLLGKYILETLKDQFIVFAFCHQHQNLALPKEQIFTVDISQKSAVIQKVAEIQPQVVIHLAALSNIDYCESNSFKARQVNVIGTQNLLETLKDTPTHFIFASSNAIFSGSRSPYQPTDQPQPINYYGRTKYEAEKIIQNCQIHSSIIRFTAMFGWPPVGARDNDVTYYVPALKKRRKLFLVNDRFFNPVYAQVAAEAVKRIIELGSSGIIHVGGKDRINRYDFVRHIKNIFVPESPSIITPVTSDFFPQLAPRPLDVTLITNSMTLLGMSAHSLDRDLITMRQEKNSQNNQTYAKKK